jgi:carbon-monoxide dehydrogenase small subunit
VKDTRNICVTVNNKFHEREVETRVSLADFLRQDLGLTGTHVGCEHGVCGACTVLVDGVSVRACLMLAAQAHESTITTVEGLVEKDGSFSLLQQAFIENHSLQCGFCTPGILITLTECLRNNPNPTEAVLRETLSGNLCRCTGYSTIIAAALDASASNRVAHQE